MCFTVNRRVAGEKWRPSGRSVSKRAVERLQADLDALRKVYSACKDRVLQEKKVPMSEKVLSLSDPDAGFIAKGQREHVIGYKPQPARSGAGFVTGLLLPQGNAPDSKNLVPMVDDVIARTKVTPKVVSVDDGYASAKNKKALEERNIEVISINGAKGRALTSLDDWKSWSRCIPFRGCETRTSNRRLKHSRPFRGHLVPCKT